MKFKYTHEMLLIFKHYFYSSDVIYILRKNVMFMARTSFKCKFYVLKQKVSHVITVLDYKWFRNTFIHTVGLQ